jgi:hypothetical protein
MCVTGLTPSSYEIFSNETFFENVTRPNVMFYAIQKIQKEGQAHPIPPPLLVEISIDVFP